MLTLVRMIFTKVRVCMIGLSNVEAGARLQQNGVNRLKPATQRAFVLQLLPRLRTLRFSMGVTPVHRR